MMRVIIVGGGYGGIKALQELAKSKTDLEVTLIDQHTYHYLQTESYDLVASKIPIRSTFIYLPTLVEGINPNFRFIQDRALKIETNLLICQKDIYPFDYLIIATGAHTKFLTGFEQKPHTSLGVKSLRSALKIKHFFEQELFDRLEPNKKHFTILVIGGGLSGVEIAAEMKHYLNEYMRSNALSCGTIHVKLVSKEILKKQSMRVRKYVQKRLKKLGVEHIQAYVDRIDTHHAYLSNQEKISFDFAIFAGGISPSKFSSDLPFAKDKRGFLVVDEYMRVDSNIFAIGDCALLKDSEGNVVPPTAQSAEQSGIIAAKNIINKIQGQPLQKANIKLLGMAISLGGKVALATTPWGFQIGGIGGYFIKKAIEKFYKIPLQLLAQKGYRSISTCKENK